MSREISKSASLRTFNNAVITGYNDFSVGKFTDMNSLYSLYKGDPTTTYLGLVRLWNQRKLVSTPILSQVLESRSVIETNGPGGKLCYDIPYEIGLPRIIDDSYTRDMERPGIGKSKFKIKLSENCFTNTDIITYDLQDGQTLYITEDEIYEEADGWVYTVMLASGEDKDFFSRKALIPGTQYVKITNVNDEYDTQKSTIAKKQGVMHLEALLGSGHRSVYHWITGYAHMLEVSGDFAGKFQGNCSSYSGKNEVMWFMNKDQNGKPLPKSLMWIRTIEAMLKAEMMSMEENDLWWNKGGVVMGSGRKAVRINLGLREQMKTGNYVQYTKLTLPLIENIVNRLHKHNPIPAEKRMTEFHVGMGFLIEISKLLNLDFKQNNPFVVNAGDIPGFIKGDAMNLSWGYRFTSKFFPVAGTVTFKHNPAFDNQMENRVTDGNGELSKFSYSAAIFDVTDKRMTTAAATITNKGDFDNLDVLGDDANIVLVKPRNWQDTYWGYEIGTIHPGGPSASKEMYSSSQRHGYGIFMQNFSSIFLKDASRTVLMERIGDC